VMRAMFLEYPDDRKAVVTGSSEFLFGRDLLVTPKVYEFLKEDEVEMPRGNWFNYWTGELVKGGKQIKVVNTVEQMAVWVREGAIIPQMPVVQNLDKLPETLELKIYAPSAGSTADCNGSLYWDDGASFGYKKGESARENFTCKSSAKGVALEAQQTGSYAPWWENVQVQVFGVERQPSRVSAGDAAIQASYDAATKSVTFTVNGPSIGKVNIIY
jgi:alpha-glucosidase